MTHLSRLVLCLVLVLSIHGTAAGQDGIAPEHVGSLDLYILAGQSNMSGRGELAGDPETVGGVYVFGNDYRWRTAREPIDDPGGQVDSVSLDANAGVGPGLAFAHALREHHASGPIGLIPCAKGATIIEEWSRSLRDDRLYGSCLKRARAASTGGAIRGLLFMQGESDAHEGATYHELPRRPGQWAVYFERMVDDMRADLGQPGLPVVFAQIGPHDSPERYVNWEQVQEQQASVRLPAVSMIRTADLSLRDRVHFDSPSYREIGRRFAVAMARLVRPTIDLQGHRGARGWLPENSVPSVLLAIEQGASTIELDVVISGDEQVVVSHEPWMSAAICRTSEGDPVTDEIERSFNLFAMTYDEIAGFDCGSRGHAGFPNQRPTAVAKPLLQEVLRIADGYALRTGRPLPRYNIEIKSREENDARYHPRPEVFSRLVYAVLDRERVLDRTTVQSFDPRPIQVLDSIDPSLRIALLVDNDDGYHANLARLGLTPDVYSPHQRLVDARLMTETDADGVHVIPWTVNDREAMDTLLHLGVDGLITDYPDRGREAIDTFLNPRD